MTPHRYTKEKKSDEVIRNKLSTIQRFMVSLSDHTDLDINDAVSLREMAKVIMEMKGRYNR
jgi:hypothetical protein